MQSDNHLRKFIFDMAGLLRQDVEIKVDETLLTLDRFRDQLDGIFAEYDEESENGSTELAALMRDAIFLFYSALDKLDEFIEEPDDELLDEACQEADKGARLLDELTEKASQQSSQTPLYGC